MCVYRYMHMYICVYVYFIYIYKYDRSQESVEGLHCLSKKKENNNLPEKWYLLE